MYNDKDTTAEQPDQNKDSTGIVLQHNDAESAADNDFASCKRSKAGLWEGMGMCECRQCECGRQLTICAYHSRNDYFAVKKPTVFP